MGCMHWDARIGIRPVMAGWAGVGWEAGTTAKGMVAKGMTAKGMVGVV